MNRAREATLFAVALTLLLLLLHRGAAVHGGLLLPLDVLGAYEPWASEFERVRPQNPALTDQVVLHPWTPLAAERLVRHGEMTLWNPHQGCGTPLHANTLSAQLYPLMWLHSLLPRHLALLAIGFLKGFLSGLFLFLFLRRRGLSPAAAALAGLAFPLSGFLTVWLGHQHTAVASLLPMLLWIVDRAVCGGAAFDLGLLGLISGCTLLAGHMETALHVLLLAIAYATARCLFADRRWPQRVGRLVQIAGGFLLGALLAMVQILPFAEYSVLYSSVLQIRHHPLYRFHNAARDLLAGETPLAALSIGLGLAACVVCGVAIRRARARGLPASLPATALALIASTLAFWLAFRLGLIDLLELLFDPDRHGNPLLGRGNGSYAGYLLYVEMNGGYASVAALLLLLCGLTLRRRGDRETLFWGGVLVLALAVVFEWPLIAQFVSKAPILAEAKNKRALLCSSLAALILAAKGLDALRCAARQRERRVLLAPVIAVTVLLGGLFTGRIIAKPESLAGRPAVPMTYTPRGFLTDHLAQVQAGRSVGYIRGTERERAWRGDPLLLDGVLFCAQLPDEVRVRLINADGNGEGRAAVSRSLPVDVAEVVAHLPQGIEAAVFRASLDVGVLPSGAYRLLTELWRNGQRVGDLPGCGIHLSRPAFHFAPWLFLASALLAIALLVLRPPLAGLAAATLVALVIADLFGFADGFNPTVDPKWDFPPTPALHWLAEHHSAEFPARVFGDPPGMHLPANIATHYRLMDIRAYDSVDIYHYSRFLLPLVVSGDEGATRAVLDAASPMFDLLAARYQLASPGSRAPADHYRVVYEGGVLIRENQHALPRAFVAEHAVSADLVLRALDLDPRDPAARNLLPHAIKRLADQGRLDLGRTVVIEDQTALPMQDVLPPPAPATPPIAARFVVDTPDRLVLNTDAPHPGVLLLADVWMPGWQARVDGIDTPVVRADIAFRAIPLQAGAHTIEFTYAPASVRIGGRLSLIALVILCVLCGAGLLRRS